jgi:hypothetical protein
VGIKVTYIYTYSIAEHYNAILLDVDNNGYRNSKNGIGLQSGQTNAFAARFPTSQFVRVFRPNAEGIHHCCLHKSSDSIHSFAHDYTTYIDEVVKAALSN